MPLAPGVEAPSWLAVSPASVKLHSNALNAVPAVMARMHAKIQDDSESVDASIAAVVCPRALRVPAP